jgi:hypothetical protein
MGRERLMEAQKQAVIEQVEAHRGQVRIPRQIDTHSAGKVALVPIQIGTCSEANRHPV